MSNNFTIAQYGPNGPFAVLPGQVDNTLSLKLLGRGAPGYGQVVAENTVRHLANFANTTAPTGEHLQGQLWFDTATTTMKVYTGSTWAVLFGEANTGTIALSADKGGTGFSVSASDAGKMLQVKTDGSGYQMITVAELASAIAAGDSPFLRDDVSSAPTTDNTIDLGSTSNKFANVYATNFIGTASSARYADLAERYEASEAVEPGDVVMIGGSKEICKAVGELSSDVFGVISTNPAFKMNSEAGDDETHPYVALVGRAPIKVVGPVRKGQRLVHSHIPGVAMGAELSAISNPFQVIGRALTDKTSTEIGLIEAVLGAK